MIRLGLVRHLIQRTPQLSTECTKFTQRGHLRSCVTKLAASTVNITSNSERDFLIRLKNDPNTFGAPSEEAPIDPKDLEEEKHFEDQPHPSQKLRTKQYADMIKAHIRKRQIKEAIDVLEVRMLKEDRVKPENYIYNLILGACGRVGYTKKAFSLYNQMKKRGLKATGGTYTALFNACANSPWPEDGLTRAKRLREIMAEKMDEPNDSTYNAMIKAFGRCGDLVTAFELVDEMLSKGLKLGDDTMNFLLQACIQDKEAGFRHALLVWREMVKKKIAPSVYTFNLMLRCIRDCEIGNIEVMSDLLDKILNKEPAKLASDTKLLVKDSSQLVEVDNLGPKASDTKLLVECAEDSQLVDIDNLRPNLMAPVPHLGNVISLSEVKKAEDRLILVGGMKGFLDNMTQHRCAPDIKTFTQLLDCLPGSLAAEKELLKTMKKFNVVPDIDFFNMLIKKRSMRFDYDSAKSVLLEMQEMDYKPNLITYGVLSLGCKTKEEGLNLIEEMKAHSYRLNAEILGAMLQQACYHRNFPYVLEIMEMCLREEVKPNKMFMEHLENFKKKCKEISNDKNNKLSQNTSFLKGFRIFRLRYKTWLEEVEIDDGEGSHPWTQYRQATETDVRKYKDKAVRFKARHISKFKVKTSTKRKR